MFSQHNLLSFVIVSMPNSLNFSIDLRWCILFKLEIRRIIPIRFSCIILMTNVNNYKYFHPVMYYTLGLILEPCKPQIAIVQTNIRHQPFCQLFLFIDLCQIFLVHISYMGLNFRKQKSGKVRFRFPSFFFIFHCKLNNISD